MNFIQKPIKGSLKEVIETSNREMHHKIYLYTGDIPVSGEFREHWILQHSCPTVDYIPECVRQGKTALDVMNEEMIKQNCEIQKIDLSKWVSKVPIEYAQSNSNSWIVRVCDDPNVMKEKSELSPLPSDIAGEAPNSVVFLYENHTLDKDLPCAWLEVKFNSFKEYFRIYNAYMPFFWDLGRQNKG